jgi:hypothetical protein
LLSSIGYAALVIGSRRKKPAEAGFFLRRFAKEREPNV